MTEINIIILAAGKGSRMKSKTPKVLHKIAGKPMIAHVRDAAQNLNPSQIIFVLAPEMEDVQDVIKPHKYVIQQTPQGTGHAVEQALPLLKNSSGVVLIMYGDVPLIESDTLQEFLNFHESQKNAATILAMAPQDPKGYGRLLQNQDGTLNKIVEEADADETQKLIRLCNSGVMIVDCAALQKTLPLLNSNNKQGEKYLTDIPEILKQQNLSTGIIRGNYAELRGVNDRAQLAALEKSWQEKTREKFLKNGVTMQDPSTIYFSHDTKIEQDVTLGAHIILGENVEIKTGAEIKSFTHLEGVIVHEGASIGPFARIRPNTKIGRNVKIGNFVEIKNSILEENSKAAHLAYIGDAELGENVNFGCGAITVNYDGISKHKTKIGNNVMIGSNSALIAPLQVGDDSYIAAGSTITETVEKEALAIARARQVNKVGKGKNRLKK